MGYTFLLLSKQLNSWVRNCSALKLVKITCLVTIKWVESSYCKRNWNIDPEIFQMLNKGEMLDECSFGAVTHCKIMVKIGFVKVTDCWGESMLVPY